MATKRFLKSSVNWAALAERMADSPQKPEFLAFKAKCDSYFQKVAALPDEPPKIDWKQYKSVSPEIVDSFQKQYESFKVPYPEDKYSHIYDSAAEESKVTVEKFQAFCRLGISRANEHLTIWKAMPPIESMSLGEFGEWLPTFLPDFVERPTFWPHTPEFQLTEQDEEEWRQKLAGIEKGEH
nr:PREDICTED: ATP synthase subunit d, mitochondrial-like [Bemisia tabaci]